MTAAGSAPPAAPGLAAAAARALELVQSGTTVGLGSGRAASAFIRALGERVRAGALNVRAVASSEASARLARSYAIPLVTIEEDTELSLVVDGADEVTPAPELGLIKGRGGALVRERILTAASARQVILVGPEKLVRRLGETGPIPVEVIPVGRGLVSRRLRALGLTPVVRQAAPSAGAVAVRPREVPGGVGDPFVSDNGNLTLDCTPPAPLSDGRAARALEAAILAIPGVVDTGLFLGTAERVIVGHDDGTVEVLLSTGTAAEAGA
ncbi:MAG TPA: ribose-5-phosphate isomerase RpiA [Polyangia bacterium]